MDTDVSAEYVMEHFVKAGFDSHGIRHRDDDLDAPASVENFVLVNRWGRILSRCEDELFNGPAYTVLTGEESEAFVNLLDREPSEPMVSISLSNLKELIDGQK